MKKAVRMILMDPTKGILAGKRTKTGYGQGQWALFGGKPDEGESPEVAVARETEEEAGVYTDPKKYLETFDDSFGERWHVTFFVSEFEGTPKLNKKEHSEFIYITPDNIDELDIAFNHRQILKRFFEERRLID